MNGTRSHDLHDLESTLGDGLLAPMIRIYFRLCGRHGEPGKDRSAGPAPCCRWQAAE